MRPAAKQALIVFIEAVVSHHIDTTPQKSLCGAYNHYLAIRKPKRAFGSIKLRRRLQMLQNRSHYVVKQALEGIEPGADAARLGRLRTKLDECDRHIALFGVGGEDHAAMADGFIAVAHVICKYDPPIGAAWLMAAARGGDNLAEVPCTKKFDRLLGVGDHVNPQETLWERLAITMRVKDRRSVLMHEIVLHARKDPMSESVPDMLIKRLYDAGRCEAELKTSGYDAAHADELSQIVHMKINEKMFHDRIVRLAWTNPRTAVTYLWWAKRQTVAGAEKVWRQLTTDVFHTVELGEMIALTDVLKTIDDINPAVWKSVLKDVIDTQIIGKEYLFKEMCEFTGTQFTISKGIIREAMDGDVTESCEVIGAYLPTHPIQAYALCRMHAFEGREVFDHVLHAMRKAWYLAKFNDVHNDQDDQDDTLSIDDVLKFGTSSPSDAKGGADGKVIVWHDMPDPKIIDGDGSKMTSDRRGHLRRFTALADGIDLREPIRNPDQLRDELLREFPWMEKTIGIIHRDMTVRRSFGQAAFLMPPLLLVGPAGTGKTRFTMRLAELVGVPYSALTLAGASDDRMLQGTAAGWSNAQPSYPVVKMNDTECANLLILLDEIDKVNADGRNGDPHASLLSMLEPESARNYHDDALMAHLDISYVNWIATANDISKMPMPLLSRFRVVEVPAPTAKDVVAIIAGVRKDFAREVDCDVRFVPYLDEAEIMYLEHEFGKYSNVRVLIRMVERLIVRREGLNRQQPN